jgi:hypothetical protein
MLLQLSLVMGTVLPLLRPDAVSVLGKRHLRGVLRGEDRLLTVGLDERKRAWVSIAAARVAVPAAGYPPPARPGGSLPPPAAVRTYLVAGGEELASLSQDARRRYSLLDTAREFHRTDLAVVLRGLRGEAPLEIPKRTFSLLVENLPPPPPQERRGP